jgi:hypothetical protein
MRLSHSPGEALRGRLSYSEEEYSFRFDVDSVVDLAARAGDAGQASVSIGSLQLEVSSDSGVVLFAWGLHPRVQWIQGKVPVPQAQPGVVRLDAEFAPGASIVLAPVGKWRTTFDSVSGWVRVAEDEGRDDDLVVEVADGVLVGERGGQLSSVWLHPSMAEHA